jgi:hypothetical protein
MLLFTMSVTAGVPRSGLVRRHIRVSAALCRNPNSIFGILRYSVGGIAVLQTSQAILAACALYIEKTNSSSVSISCNGN